MVIKQRINTKDFLKAYCLTALLAILPIILFVPRYVDDYGRSTEGYLNWTKEGFRPLADVIYYLFNLGEPATALAPLAQLLSVPFPFLITDHGHDLILLADYCGF